MTKCQPRSCAFSGIEDCGCCEVKRSRHVQRLIVEIAYPRPSHHAPPISLRFHTRCPIRSRDLTPAGPDPALRTGRNPSPQRNPWTLARRLSTCVRSAGAIPRGFRKDGHRSILVQRPAIAAKRRIVVERETTHWFIRQFHKWQHTRSAAGFSCACNCVSNACSGQHHNGAIAGGTRKDNFGDLLPAGAAHRRCAYSVPSVR